MSFSDNNVIQVVLWLIAALAFYLNSVTYRVAEERSRVNPLDAESYAFVAKLFSFGYFIAMFVLFALSFAVTK